MIEHEPAAKIVTVEPEIVQTVAVVDANATVRPDVDVAVRPNGASPKVFVPGFVKAIA